MKRWPAPLDEQDVSRMEQWRSSARDALIHAAALDAQQVETLDRAISSLDVSMNATFDQHIATAVQSGRRPRDDEMVVFAMEINAAQEKFERIITDDLQLDPEDPPRAIVTQMFGGSVQQKLAYLHEEFGEELARLLAQSGVDLERE